jgi:hypothetical protein
MSDWALFEFLPREIGTVGKDELFKCIKIGKVPFHQTDQSIPAECSAATTMTGGSFVLLNHLYLSCFQPDRKQQDNFVSGVGQDEFVRGLG